ncbi:MAG: hypothetical protein N2489_07450 [Clostridia bacterium]|nr:hypothetical protein [Clostridia bacterium]
MEYLYKPDWERAKKMFEAYWHQANEERCLLSVKAVKGVKHENPSWGKNRDDETLEDHWFNTEKILKRYVNYFENTYFAAEALPMVNVNLGPGVTAAYLGCKYNLESYTVWFEHIIQDWEKDSFEFDENSFMWKKTMEITQTASEMGKGKFFVNQTDLSGVIDIIAHLRGTQELLYDLTDYPDEVKAARDKILEIWFKCLNRLYDITRNTNDGGSLSWLAVWSPGLCHALQCDFAAMISPAMFQEFALPEIEKQCRELPYSIFHLDGPGMVCHLDSLLEIKELNAIQWQPGAGAPNPVQWPDLLKKIQNKGKSIHTWASCREALDMLDYLSPEGLYIDVYDMLNSPQEADDFIKEAEKKCKGKF